jgi:general L-amino acid transport system substrate-binding protein
MKSTIRAALGAAVLTAAVSAPGIAHAGETLDSIKERGVLRCGVSTGLQGFSAPDSQGKWTGIDADFCRAVAAAVLGDASKVQFVPSTAQVRFTLLQSGEVDLLSRNTTWTSSRDSTLGSVFAGTLFYDGQGFMLRKDLGVTKASELSGASVCVQPGTTTELNLSDYFRANGMEYKPVVITELSQVEQAFFSGRCDVYTTDISGLAATRQKADNPDDYMILPNAISKEPLGPMLRRGDWEFFTIVKWVLYGLVEAEELGVTTANVDEMTGSNLPAVQRLLGVKGEVGTGLGLDDQWMVRAIKAVGNYGEMYDRNVGPLGISRGQNAQWKDGGLMYAPPMR